MTDAVLSQDDLKTCELCNTTSVAVLHVSRRTGQRVGRCRSCRLVTVLDQLPHHSIRDLYNSTEGYRIYVEAQRVEGLRRRHQATIRRVKELVPRPLSEATIFDVGAGAGEFLALARTAGFDVQGNEISEPAARECFRRHGITLSTTELGDEAGENRFDAMTMWCVLAHVADPRQLLADALRLLRPDGVLYFHTPRWCMIDVAGLAATRLSSGMLSQITERRVNAAHMRLYDQRNLRHLLHTVGFEIVDIRSVSGYSLQAASYLQSMGLPGAVVRPLAVGFEGLIDNDLFVRNTLDVYARKPARARLRGR
ncbi:MAG: class I SAM-dependent methyltransferase [Actinomycetota bacterium]|nr:class I SAM-dependent methyltransferase [Actinomycetota bacterium]